MGVDLEDVRSRAMLDLVDSGHRGIFDQAFQLNNQGGQEVVDGVGQEVVLVE